MDSTFGTRLRMQREEQQIPLATIAEQTKIKLSLLEGLERDDVARWPTGLFRRSYFRAYARAIGLDPDHALREFQALYPDPDADTDVTQALAQAHGLNDSARRPPTRLRCLIDSAVSALPTLHLPPNPKAATGLPAPAPVSPDAGYQAFTEAAVEPVRIPALPPPPPDEADQALIEYPVEPEAAQITLAEPVRPVSEHIDVDFVALAELCMRLARANDVHDVTPVLDSSAGVLHAIGLVLWMVDPLGCELIPVFSSGYAPEMTAQIGRVPRDAENAVAYTFRAAEPRVVDGGEVRTGAVVVPLLTPTGCIGVLGIELRDGRERLECIRTAARILAAQLSTLVGVSALAEAVGV